MTPYYERDGISVYCADARDAQWLLPPDSVTLILTDPIYDRWTDYAWLRSLACLRGDGNILTFVNAKHLPAVVRMVPIEHPPLAYIQTSGASPMNGRVIAKTYYLLWWGSGKLVGYMPDGYVGTTWSKPDTHKHRWAKNPKYLRAVIAAFTKPGDLVLDPYMGSGPVLEVAKAMERQAIGIEQDAECCAIAVDRLRQGVLPLEVS